MPTFNFTGTITQAAQPCEGVINWTARSAITFSVKVVWCSSINLFVSIKQDSVAGVIQTSPDGITWTQRSVSTSGSPFWQSIAWSPALSLLVAVASSGTNRVMTSPDGINWTQRSASNASTWRRVDWIPGLNLFVAGANAWGVNVNIMTSPDGINWTTRNSPSFQSRGFAWSQSAGLIVAVSDTSPFILTSPDGINWTTRTASGSPQFTDVKWIDGLNEFIATSSVAPLFSSSPDGINWTGYDGGIASAVTRINSISWSPELATIVVIGYNSTAVKSVYSSKDGLTWTPRTSPSPSNNWLYIAWSPSLGIFCAVGSAGTFAMTSDVCP